MNRRQFLFSTANALRVAQPAGVPEASANSLSGAYPPASQAFHHRARSIPPINPDYWGLYMGGMGSAFQMLTYADLKRFPAADLPCAVACVGSAGLPRQAVWQGVAMETVYDALALTSKARYAQIMAADGYTTYLPQERLRSALLIYAMNGEPLTPTQGFPARLLVPGLYGYKMPKWIQRIQFTDHPVAGFWEAKGWSADGIAQTTSAILRPQHLESVSASPVTLAGFAYAGERSIVQVEVSVDDGPWMPVPFTPSAPFCWTPWQINWPPPSPGDYLIKVRATDSSGFTQSDQPGLSFPNGSSAVQSVVVRVTP